MEEQGGLRHVLAEAAFYHAGDDEGFEEGGGSGAGSGILDFRHAASKFRVKSQKLIHQRVPVFLSQPGRILPRV